MSRAFAWTDLADSLGLPDLIRVLNTRMPRVSRAIPPITAGSGVPATGLGTNGDYYLRTDTPGVANQRLYVKNAGNWTGIL